MPPKLGTIRCFPLSDISHALLVIHMYSEGFESPVEISKLIAHESSRYLVIR